jgi:hypothetical protein
MRPSCERRKDLPVAALCEHFGKRRAKPSEKPLRPQVHTHKQIGLVESHFRKKNAWKYDRGCLFDFRE